MPRTLEEYHRKWRAMGEEHGHPDDDGITPTSCVLTGSYLASAPGMSDAFFTFDDFGDAVGFCRYYALLEEAWSWHGDEEEASLQEAEHYFDALLERFVRNGYHPGMGNELLDDIGEYFRVFQLGSIYVLPGDLDALLDYTGNPFKPLWGSGEDEEGEEDEADEHYKAEFNLENPAHCNALYTRLNDRIS